MKRRAINKKRLAIVLSVVWCLGLTAALWLTEINQRQDWLRGMVDLCMDMPDASKSMPCIQDVTANFNHQVADLYRGFWKEALVFCVGTLAIGWLIVGGVIGVLRWVAPQPTN